MKLKTMKKEKQIFDIQKMFFYNTPSYLLKSLSDVDDKIKKSDIAKHIYNGLIELRNFIKGREVLEHEK